VPRTMSQARDQYLQRSQYLNGAEIATSWTPEEREAWAGFFAYTVRLPRLHSLEFEASHQLSIGMIGLLGRLLAAEQHSIRLTDLANAMDLSLGRVSRIVDVLEQRGLIERTPCPGDARAVNAVLTRRGVTVTRKAQATSRDAVRRDFVDLLNTDEIALLGDIFERLLAHLER
jgi:DNA-binding MarR family transcriptional regulator